jgi:hypothetical protein
MVLEPEEVRKAIVARLKDLVESLDSGVDAPTSAGVGP